MRSNGILRFITACIICLSVISYNGVMAFNFKSISNETQQGNDPFLLFEDSLSSQEEEKNAVSQSQSEPEEESSQPEANISSEQNGSVQASTAAVKGKVISRYISPYTASLSYDGVYMKNNTGLNIDIKKLLNSNLSFKITDTSEPQVLIMHTHTTESYLSSDSEFYTEEYTSRSRDNQKNMVKIGSIVAEKLNSAGIKTLHDTTQHDYPQYNGSYTRAAETITAYLKKYPSIKIVLDLHRDAVTSGESDKVKLVTEIEGKKAAQVMLVMGSQSGSVTNFPNWQENLKLALKLQQTMEKKYPTLARPLSLMSKNYNESLTKGSLLLEFGTDANSLEEACYSAELVGNSLVSLLNNLV